MERLTEHNINKSLGAYMVCSMTCDNSICRVDCREISKIVDRLAAYEDTGLEPEEIKAIIDSDTKEFSEYDELMPKHRIKELAQAEKDGRLAGHGRWIYNEKGNLYRCSVCLEYPSFIPTHCHISKYCPSCGAKMDLSDMSLKKRGGGR